MKKHQGPGSRLSTLPRGGETGVWFLVLFSACLIFFFGCAVGPNYKRPIVTSPSGFRGDPSPTNTSFADLNWWLVYQDTNLQALIREAFTNNS